MILYPFDIVCHDFYFWRNLTIMLFVVLDALAAMVSLFSLLFDSNLPLKYTFNCHFLLLFSSSSTLFPLP